jgi:hypothetical protein
MQQILLLTLFLLSFSINAKALNEASAKYKINNYEAYQKSTNGNATIDLEGTVKLSILMGEPVVFCNAKWDIETNWLGKHRISFDGEQLGEKLPQSVLDKISLHSVKIKFYAGAIGSLHYYLNCDLGAFAEANSDKFSFNSSGSPSWDKLFHQGNGRLFASEEQAKQIIKQNFKDNSLDFQPKVIKASINLIAVELWLEKLAQAEKERLRQEKIKQELEKLKKQKAQKIFEQGGVSWGSGDFENSKEQNKDANFWTGGAEKSTTQKQEIQSRKTQSQKATSKNTKKSEEFWQGTATKQEQESFWTGDNKQQRQKHLAEKRRKEAAEWSGGGLFLTATPKCKRWYYYDKKSKKCKKSRYK